MQHEMILDFVVCSAAEFVMDYLKTDAVFWKKEQTESGSRWIQSTENDQQRAEMWQAKDA